MAHAHPKFDSFLHDGAPYTRPADWEAVYQPKITSNYTALDSGTAELSHISRGFVDGRNCTSVVRHHMQSQD
jgi:hypothetical protein